MAAEPRPMLSLRPRPTLRLTPEPTPAPEPSPRPARRRKRRPRAPPPKASVPPRTPAAARSLKPVPDQLLRLDVLLRRGQHLAPLTAVAPTVESSEAAQRSFVDEAATALARAEGRPRLPSDRLRACRLLLAEAVEILGFPELLVLAEKSLDTPRLSSLAPSSEALRLPSPCKSVQRRREVLHQQRSQLEVAADEVPPPDRGGVPLVPELLPFPELHPRGWSLPAPGTVRVSKRAAGPLTLQEADLPSLQRWAKGLLAASGLSEDAVAADGAAASSPRKVLRVALPAMTLALHELLEQAAHTCSTIEVVGLKVWLPLLVLMRSLVGLMASQLSLQFDQERRHERVTLARKRHLTQVNRIEAAYKAKLAPTRLHRVRLRSFLRAINVRLRDSERQRLDLLSELAVIKLHVAREHAVRRCLGHCAHGKLWLPTPMPGAKSGEPKISSGREAHWRHVLLWRPPLWDPPPGNTCDTHLHLLSPKSEGAWRLGLARARARSLTEDSVFSSDESNDSGEENEDTSADSNPRHRRRFGSLVSVEEDNGRELTIGQQERSLIIWRAIKLYKTTRALRACERDLLDVAEVLCPRLFALGPDAQASRSYRLSARGTESSHADVGDALLLRASAEYETSLAEAAAAAGVKHRICGNERPSSSTTLSPRRSSRHALGLLDRVRTPRASTPNFNSRGSASGIAALASAVTRFARPVKRRRDALSSIGAIPRPLRQLLQWAHIGESSALKRPLTGHAASALMGTMLRERVKLTDEASGGFRAEGAVVVSQPWPEFVANFFVAKYGLLSLCGIRFSNFFATMCQLFAEGEALRSDHGAALFRPSGPRQLQAMRARVLCRLCGLGDRPRLSDDVAAAVVEIYREMLEYRAHSVAGVAAIKSRSRHRGSGAGGRGSIRRGTGGLLGGGGAVIGVEGSDGTAAAFVQNGGVVECTNLGKAGNTLRAVCKSSGILGDSCAADLVQELEGLAVAWWEQIGDGASSDVLEGRVVDQLWIPTDIVLAGLVQRCDDLADANEQHAIALCAVAMKSSATAAKRSMSTRVDGRENRGSECGPNSAVRTAARQLDMPSFFDFVHALAPQVTRVQAAGIYREVLQGLSMAACASSASDASGSATMSHSRTQAKESGNDVLAEGAKHDTLAAAVAGALRRHGLLELHRTDAVSRRHAVLYAVYGTVHCARFTAPGVVDIAKVKMIWNRECDNVQARLRQTELHGGEYSYGACRHQRGVSRGSERASSCRGITRARINHLVLLLRRMESTNGNAELLFPSARHALHLMLEELCHHDVDRLTELYGIEAVGAVTTPPRKRSQHSKNLMLNRLGSITAPIADIYISSANDACSSVSSAEDGSTSDDDSSYEEPMSVEKVRELEYVINSNIHAAREFKQEIRVTADLEDEINSLLHSSQFHVDRAENMGEGSSTAESREVTEAEQDARDVERQQREAKEQYVQRRKDSLKHKLGIIAA